MKNVEFEVVKQTFDRFTTGHYNESRTCHAHTNAAVVGIVVCVVVHAAIFHALITGNSI